MSNPSFKGRRPASKRATAAARGASRKADTKCEVRLRKELHRRGLRYRKDVARLPGRPDIVFASARVIVFCDGDFWHGKDWGERRKKLAAGHNADYWLAKIERNMERDRAVSATLEAEGWMVIRVWESEIRKRLGDAADRVESLVRRRQHSAGDVTSSPGE